MHHPHIDIVQSESVQTQLETFQGLVIPVILPPLLRRYKYIMSVTYLLSKRVTQGMPHLQFSSLPSVHERRVDVTITRLKSGLDGRLGVAAETVGAVAYPWHEYGGGATI